MVLTLSLLSLLLLEIMCGTIKPQKIQSLTITKPNLNKQQLVLVLGGTLFSLLSILKFVSLLWGILISRKILQSVDYSILLTFIFCCD